jgi:hypothetical protein
MSVPGSVLKWLPLKHRKRILEKMKKDDIENNFENWGLDINEIFYIKTWSLDFLDNVLQPDHVEFWDHISKWYDLTEEFCEKNIDWVNFYDVFYNQTLPKPFYLRHLEKIDWVSADLNQDNLYDELYSKFPLLND